MIAVEMTSLRMWCPPWGQHTETDGESQLKAPWAGHYGLMEKGQARTSRDRGQACCAQNSGGTLFSLFCTFDGSVHATYLDSDCTLLRYDGH